MANRIKIVNPASKDRAKAIPAKKWEEHGPIITRLWIDEDKTISEVIEIMTVEYGFRASEPQYRQKFKQWKIKKNVPAKVKRCVSRKLHQNPRLHSFELGPLPVSDEKVLRYLRSHPDFDRTTSPTASTPSPLQWISSTPSIPSPGPYSAPQSPPAEPPQPYAIDGMVNLFRPDDPLATEPLSHGLGRTATPAATKTAFEVPSLPLQCSASLTNWLDQTAGNNVDLSPPPSESRRAQPSPASWASSPATSEQPGMSESHFDRFVNLSRTTSRPSSVAGSPRSTPSPVLSSMSDTSTIMGMDELERDDVSPSPFRPDDDALHREHARLRAAAPRGTVDTYPAFDGAPIATRLMAYRAAHPKSPPPPPPPSPFPYQPQMPLTSYHPDPLGSKLAWFWHCSECEHINHGVLAGGHCLECSHTQCTYCREEIMREKPQRRISMARDEIGW